MNPNTIWICEECNWRGPTSQLDFVADPMQQVEGDGWQICPKCRSADKFVDQCDEPGCKDWASSGWPSDAGYRRTCHIHSDWYKKRIAEPTVETK